jgi:hypothetical protein
MQALFFVPGPLGIGRQERALEAHKAQDPPPQRRDSASGAASRPQTVLLHGKGEQQSMKRCIGAHQRLAIHGRQADFKAW